MVSGVGTDLFIESYRNRADVGALARRRIEHKKVNEEAVNVVGEEEAELERDPKLTSSDSRSE